MAGNISITNDDIMRVCTFAALILSIILITNFVRPNSAQGLWIVRQYEGRALDIRRISTFSKNKLGPKFVKSPVDIRRGSARTSSTYIYAYKERMTSADLFLGWKSPTIHRRGRKNVPRLHPLHLLHPKPRFFSFVKNCTCQYKYRNRKTIVYLMSLRNSLVFFLL